MKLRLKTFDIPLAQRPRSYGQASGPDDAAAIARSILESLGDGDQEQFLVLSLSARGTVQGFKRIALGTKTACLVHPRGTFRAAIELGAASIILVHNHPSGDPSPSSEDRALTERLELAGTLIGIPVLDHLIITADDFCAIGNSRDAACAA